jgi:hypothetical protein
MNQKFLKEESTREDGAATTEPWISWWLKWGWLQGLVRPMIQIEANFQNIALDVIFENWSAKRVSESKTN